MAKLFHVNSNAKANDGNGPTNDALWLGILNIAIQAGNYIHDSITGEGGKFLKKLWCCVGGSITR